MAKKRKKLSDQIRRAVTMCGKSRYQIAKATGIDQAALSRFVGGGRGLELATLDTLADYLRLNIQASKKKG